MERHMEGGDPYAKYAKFELSAEDQEREEVARQKVQTDRDRNHWNLQRFRESGIDQKSVQKYRHRSRPN